METQLALASSIVYAIKRIVGSGRAKNGTVVGRVSATRKKKRRTVERRLSAAVVAVRTQKKEFSGPADHWHEDWQRVRMHAGGRLKHRAVAVFFFPSILASSTLPCDRECRVFAIANRACGSEFSANGHVPAVIFGRFASAHRRRHRRCRLLADGVMASETI